VGNVVYLSPRRDQNRCK